MLITLAAGIALAVVAQTAVDPNGWSRQRRLTANLVRLRSENNALDEQVNLLRDQIQALRTRTEVQERTIRDELGWVRDGDQVIYFDAQHEP